MPVDSVRALLIENKADDAQMICEALATAGGVAITWVRQLDEGIKRLRQADIDLVLLDLASAQMAGFDAIRCISQEAPHIPVVVLSGSAESAQAEDAVKFGAEDYLIKDALAPDLLKRSVRYAIDRRSARELVAEGRDSALESARLRGEFLANMSHEIRTPLNGIVGMTRLLMDTRLTNDQREMIDIARQSADSLLRIVNDILDFSKIAAGKVALEETGFDLNTAVESVLALFLEQAQRKGIELTSYVDSDLPTAVRGDAARLCQVLSNFVSNAIKFTPYGEVVLRVSLVQDRAPAGVVVRFVVKDTGIGIPFDGQRHLFQAFAQADGSTTRKFGGTGLGLAICAQLVELMGGNIGVQSEPGGGSTFWFTATLGQQALPAKTPEPANAPLTGMRLLIFDRSDAAARVVQQHARDWRIGCEIAANPAAVMVALKSAAANGTPVDVVIIDLPHGSNEGLTLGRAIKADPALAHTCVIGTYGLGGRPSETQAHQAGIRAMLVKPIRQTELRKALNVVAEGAIGSLNAAPVTATPRRRRISELKSQLPEELRSRIRILLVEDNPVNQQVELRTLERIGFHAQSVNNGREALEAMERAAYDLVLMDCQMPEMDGYTATRAIRRREGSRRRVVIIGVTAYALAGDREECLACGMDDYIAKPVVPEDLAATLEKWVRHISESRPEIELVSAPPAHAPGAINPDILDGEVLAELRECARPGETNFLKRLIDVFLQDLAARFITIRDGLARGDAPSITATAEALKGAAAAIGARRMAAQCGRVETAARAGNLASLSEILATIELEATSLRSALGAEQTRLSA